MVSKPQKWLSPFAFRTHRGTRQKRKGLPEVICYSAAQLGQDPGLQPPSPGVSLCHTNWIAQSAWLSSWCSFSLDSASALFFLGPPGLLAGARLSAGRTVCAVEKALGWPGLEAKAHPSPCLLEDLRQTCTSPLAQFPLWSNQGLGQGLPGSFQPSDPLILWRPSPLPGFPESLIKARVWLSKAAAPNLRSGAPGQKPSPASLSPG